MGSERVRGTARRLSLALRWALAGIFAASAGLKAYDLPATVLFVAGVTGLPPLPVRLLLVGLVLTEAALAGGLLLRPRPGVYLGAGALVLGASGWAAWLLAQDVSGCGCFGTVVEIGPGETLVKNALLLGGLGLLWRRAPPPSSRLAGAASEGPT